jgi:hypothetical protein
MIDNLLTASRDIFFRFSNVSANVPYTAAKIHWPRYGRLVNQLLWNKQEEVCNK